MFSLIRFGERADSGLNGIMYVWEKVYHNVTEFRATRKQTCVGQYPQLIGGMFFSIQCKCNYELIRELSSFGANLIVLSPKVIQDEIIGQVRRMMDGYEKMSYS